MPELCPDDELQSQLPEHITVEPLWEVKSTSKYPVDDLYTWLELTEPESRAICSAELHDDDVQRLMVTLS